MTLASGLSSWKKIKVDRYLTPKITEEFNLKNISHKKGLSENICIVLGWEKFCMANDTIKKSTNKRLGKCIWKYLTNQGDVTSS